MENKSNGKQKKISVVWDVIGVLVGLIAIIIGIYFYNSPADHYYTDTAESTSFGADYYTYEYEATRIAGVNAAVTANNIRAYSEKVSEYISAAFLILGLLVFIYYGKNLTLTLSKKQEQIMEDTSISEEYVNNEQENFEITDIPEENTLDEI